MKKYLILLAATISMSAFVGCSSDDDDAGFNYVTFEAPALELIVEENSSQSREVTVYTGNVTGSDRTFEILVDTASTVNAEAYTVPATVVVPGGSNEATFTVDVSDTNLSNTGETLILRLENEEGLFTGNALSLNISRFCAIDINDYIGTFEGAGSWSATQGYTTEVVTFLNEDGDLMINGLLFQWFQDWWGEEIVTNQAVMIEINEETGAITIPEQPYITSTYEGEAQDPYSIKATGMVNACDRSLTIRPVLVQDGVELTGTNWDGGVTFVETIRVDPDAGEETDGEETDGEETDGEETDGGDTEE